MALQLSTQPIGNELELQKKWNNWEKALEVAINPKVKNNLNTDLFKLALVEIIKTNPRILQCTETSVYLALSTCAKWGLIPGTAEQDCALVPYKNELKPILMYKGLLKFLYRSGEIRSIVADTVHKGDTFEYEKGLNPKLKHIKVVNQSRKFHSLEHVYCVVTFKDGQKEFEVLTRNEVMDIKIATANGSSNSPWTDELDANEMAKKTCLKKLAKYLPISSDEKIFISEEDSREDGNLVDVEIKDNKVSQSRGANTMEYLKNKIAPKEEKKEEITIEPSKDVTPEEATAMFEQYK